MQSVERTISEIVALYNITLRTLRFYEDRGLLQPIRRGTARYYTPKDVIRLELILKGKRFGFTLSEVQKLIGAAASANPEKTDGRGDDFTSLLKVDDVARRIQELEVRRSSLDEAIVELRRKLA